MNETSWHEVLRDGSEPALAAHTKNLSIYEGKLATRRRLAQIDPTNPQWRCDEAEILDVIGNEYRSAGMTASAIGAYQQSCTILRELADLNPRNLNLLKYLTIGLARLAETRLDAGDLEGALANQEECSLINRKLRKRDPRHRQQMAAAETLAKVGDLRLEIGDDEGALEAYEELLPIERHLASADPCNACLKWNLSRTLNRLGDIQFALMNPVSALSFYDDSLAILHNLAELNPTDVQLQEEVRSSLKKIGDLKRDAGGYSNDAEQT